MTSYYTRSHSQSSGYDYYYGAAPNSSASVARAARRNPRHSPMAPTPATTYVSTYASTYKTRPVRPTVTRAPASAPSVPYAPSHTSSRRSHESSPYSTPSGSTYMRAASSKSSLRTPRASFDVGSGSAHHKHVAFADPRPSLKQNNTWSAGDVIPKVAAFPVKLHSAATSAHSSDFKMHGLLAHSRFRRASISYDVQQPPTSKALIDRRERTPVSAVVLSEPATVPALPCNAQLTLTSSSLPWPIVVSPSPSGGHGARHTPITNLDVLAAVHAALHRPAGKAEWDALGTNSSAQRRVREAFERRCAISGGRDKGLKRIDWLCGKSRLVGVEVDRHGAGATGRLVFSTPKA